MRFSIVIPTHQRRDLVTRNVAALQRQVEQDFEVIVVDDGSSDGTATALRRLEVPFPLTVIEQENKGVGAARNAGAAIARGEYIVFLDDDMEADPRMLAEHSRSHAGGADFVLGDLPLHPDSPRNLLSWGVGWWARTRRDRLGAAGTEIPATDMLTGQLSISRQDYQRIGGFDTGFTRRGLAPGADLDFGHRARNAGLRVVFNPDAISYQYYDVDPAEYLKRAREDGRSAHELLVKHPDQAAKLGNVPGFARRRDRWLLGPFLVAPAAVSWPLRAAVVALARSGHTGKRLRDLFFLFRTLERLRGLRMARRAGSTGKAVVLAYHAIGDRRGDAILRRYSVPPGRFARQLDSLASAGWTFIDASMLLGALSGERRLPRRAALLTFDDGYVDFATAALPELTRRDVPAIVFVVAEQIGGANDWDQQIGGGVAQLMDADALRRIAAKGVEIGSHGLRHRSMAELDSSSLAAEASESAAALESLGLDRPRLFAYPYGHCTPDAEAEIHQAGYRAAFTVSPGVVARGCNLYALPRIQVLRGYMPAILRLKLATARWSPHWLERLFGIVGARG